MTPRLPYPHEWVTLSQEVVNSSHPVLDLRANRLAPLELARQTLVRLQSWLQAEQLEALTVLTRFQDMAGWAVWGLVRSLRWERPDLILRLLTCEQSEDDSGRVKSLVERFPAQEGLLRSGLAHEFRLQPIPPIVPTGENWAGEGTVLITGGTGALGRVLAEHLVKCHGVKNLLLVSRSGTESPSIGEWSARICKSYQVQLSVQHCDVSDRSSLSRLLGGISLSSPLVGVFHLAVVLRDATFTNQTQDSIREVFAAKVQAALHLHELTREKWRERFVLVSSASGLGGAPGQAN